MTQTLVLASGSATRLDLLRAAGLDPKVAPARVDEDTIRRAATTEGFTPREIADILAEAKATKISTRYPDALVIGCDQMLDLDGQCLAKPDTPDAARNQLRMLSGRDHRLYSAAVIVSGGQPIWRHIGAVRLWMRPLQEADIDRQLTRMGDAALLSPGSYRVEGPSLRLFRGIDGAYHDILGLPLLELLNFLVERGTITP